MSLIDDKARFSGQVPLHPVMKREIEKDQLNLVTETPQGVNDQLPAEGGSQGGHDDQSEKKTK